MKNIFLYVSWLLRYLLFRYSVLCLLSLGVWLRAILFPFIILAGLVAATGDWLYLQGIKRNDLEFFKLAKKIFPFDRNLIIVEAEYYLHNKIVNKEGLISINEALKTDMYSSRLWNMQMQYSSVLGDRQLAAYSFQKLYKLTPNIPIVQELIKRGAKVRD